MPRRKGLKICCALTAVFLLAFAILVATLSLTVFKPKQPEITAHPVALENIATGGGFPNVTLNVTLTMIVTIDNRNYGSFEYENTTAQVSYRGETVADVPTGAALVPARSKVNISTSAELMADKLLMNPHFVGDVEAGSLNLSSLANLHGKVTMLKIFSLHARASSACDLTLWIKTQKVDSKCKSKIKL